MSTPAGQETGDFTPELDDNADPPAAIRLLLIDQERQMWINTRYMHKLRYKVQRQVEAPENDLKAIEVEVSKCERALEQLAELRIALVAEIEIEQEETHG